MAGLEIPFMAKAVKVGTDPDGDPITRTVIDWNTPQQQPTDAGWSKSLLLLRRVLMTLLVDNGQDMQPFLDGPIVRACDLSPIRAEFEKQYVADGNDRQKADAKRKAFKRAVQDAQAKNLIATRELGG